MIPGWIAGEYERAELELDVRLMARRAGVGLVVGRVVVVEAERHALALADGSRIPYDLASLDVGSATSGPPAGTQGFHVSAREPDEIVDGLEALRHGAVVVVGGGAAGVELAACARAVVEGPVTLVEAGDRLMANHDPSVSKRVREELVSRSISVRLDDEVQVEAGSTQPSHRLTIWATGAEGPTLLRGSGLPVDDLGFVRVDQHLAVVEVERLFAVGDCASLEHDAAPKAGFHAIQQGKVLADNLAAAVGSWPRPAPHPRRYRPRSDFLTLLNLGDGHALGTKWGVTLEGRWVRRLKDVIDRRWVERFQSG